MWNSYSYYMMAFCDTELFDPQKLLILALV